MRLLGGFSLAAKAEDTHSILRTVTRLDLTVSEFGKAILQAISRALHTEESLNCLNNNYIKQDYFYCYGDKN